MNPLDIDTDWGSKLAHHIPLIGAAVGAVRATSKTEVSLWQLIVAVVGTVIGLGSLFGSSVYWLARQQAETEGWIHVINAQQAAQDAIIARIAQRQDINNERISRLESATAVLTANADRLSHEHAEIYQAVRGKR
jgi:hypothetical protein